MSAPVTDIVVEQLMVFGDVDLTVTISYALLQAQLHFNVISVAASRHTLLFHCIYSSPCILCHLILNYC